MDVMVAYDPKKGSEQFCVPGQRVWPENIGTYSVEVGPDGCVRLVTEEVRFRVEGMVPGIWQSWEYPGVKSPFLDGIVRPGVWCRIE